jgi:hypothetical protein
MIKSTKNYFLLLLFTAIITGCTTVPLANVETVKPTKLIKLYPEVQKEVTGDLGETLVSKTILNFIEGVEVLEEIVWEVSNVKYTIPPQKIKKLFVADNGNMGFSPPEWSIEGNNIGPWIAFKYSIEKSYHLWEGVWGRTTTIDSSLIKAAELEWEEPLDFEQQLIYNGRVNNSLRFVYREFNNDMARSAFTQEVQYDLKESKIIGFKNVRIEVIEATNSSITYKVLKAF